MDPVSALLALVPLAISVEGGVESLITLIGNLHAGGQLSTDQVQEIRDDGSLADASLDDAIAQAKARLAKGNP
jgi:hypothetical protein